METTWTLNELVDRVADAIRALPPPKNGQVRAVPDERTIRYYATLGLLDRPAAMRGRTALYEARHLAQVVAIKRLQSAGRSLAEIEALWPTFDDATLARMSGVALVARRKPAVRSEFWKRDPARASVPHAATRVTAPTPPVELRIELAPHVMLTIAMPDDGVALSSADVRAIRAAATPLIDELARRRLAHDELTSHAEEETP